MRIAVLEAVSAGLCGENPSPSLLAEGMAMWRAVVKDLLAIPDVMLDTVVDCRWHHLAPASLRLHCWNVTDAVEAIACWESSLEDADASWIIAPECDGLLERLVTTATTRTVSWNADPTAIRLCTDKLALARHLLHHEIATIPTDDEPWQAPPDCDHGSFIVKPRDGAGSHLVRRVDCLADWQTARTEFIPAAESPRAIRQPYIAGKALSIAGWFHPHGVEWFPVAEQQLSDDGHFTYLGGTVPARIAPHEHAAIRHLGEQAAATIDGLRGYIGFDIVLPIAAPHQPMLVEINPRLTTSYIAYRRLCADNLLAKLTDITNRVPPALRWRTDRRITFKAEGDVREIMEV